MIEKGVCKFCEREYEKKNKRHLFCSKDCAYCWRSGKGTEFENMSFRERSGGEFRYGYRGVEHGSSAVAETPKPSAKPENRVKPERKPETKRRWEPEQVFIRANKYQGFVYLMYAENGMYKIGRAKDVESRKKGVEREIPLKIRIIHTIATKNSIKAEAYLHERYAACRIRYEWFALSDEQANQIKSIRDFDLDLDTQ